MLKPFPITKPRECAGGFEVLMSDGSSVVFDRYGLAIQFIEAHPAPPLRNQLRASLASTGEGA